MKKQGKLVEVEVEILPGWEEVIKSERKRLHLSESNYVKKAIKRYLDLVDNVDFALLLGHDIVVNGLITKKEEIK